MEADREEKREGEVEEIGPEQSGKTAESESKAVDKDAAAFDHWLLPSMREEPIGYSPEAS